VRQVGYKSHGKKAVSEEAFYECVSVDLFDTSSRVPCLADKVELPAPERLSPDSDIPSLFIVVAHIPSETGPMSVGPDADGLMRRPFLESRRTRRGDGVEVTPSTRELDTTPSTLVRTQATATRCASRFSSRSGRSKTSLH
jgi:hypothetical protein